MIYKVCSKTIFLGGIIFLFLFYLGCNGTGGGGPFPSFVRPDENLPNRKEEETEQKISTEQAEYLKKVKSMNPVTEYREKNINTPKAAEHDDNEEFEYYLSFLKDNMSNSILKTLNIEGRRLVSINDKNGLPIFNSHISFKNNNYYSYSDGEVLIPGDSFSGSLLSIDYNGFMTNIAIGKTKNQREVINLPIIREEKQIIPLDIVFLMDTTKSMQDEIDTLRDTIYSVYMHIKNIPSKNIAVRFGMVLYRDKGDEYLTKEFDLTPDMDKFQEFLFSVEAKGGGDYPEAMLDGFSKSLTSMQWNKDAVKFVFLITDASAHMRDFSDLENLYTQARKQAIKVYSIGASGLDLTGEIQLRVLSQMTKGKFVFLTYGERGESSGKGTEEDPGKVSHHTGANYMARNLDDIVVDNIRMEIYNQLPEKELMALHQNYDYKNEEDKVFRRVDNSLQQIKKQIETGNKLNSGNSVLGLPPDSLDKSLDSLSIYIGSLSEDIISQDKMMKVVDRTKIKMILEELKLKLSGAASSENIKELTGADTILTGKLYFVANSTVLFMRLIDASTSEVIAASMVKM